MAYEQTQTLDDLFALERESMNIPYSTYLTPEEEAISNEMSNYGSTLIPSLAACGLFGLGCISGLCWKLGRHTHPTPQTVNHIPQPGDHPSNPIVIIDDDDWVKLEK